MLQFNSRVDKIASDLHEQISHGKLKPGERLPSERSLCSIFGVGRTTIREALKSLAVRGLVTRHGRGAVVTDPELVLPRSPDLPGLAAQTSIRQLFELRKLIEVRVAGWAAVRAQPDDVESMKRAIEAERLRDVASGNPNRMFHDALVRAAHNPALIQIYESGRNIFFRLPFYWKLFDDAEIKSVRASRHELARRWHEEILKAICEHDAAEAEGAMFQHLDIMEKDLLRRLKPADSASESQKPYSHPLLISLAPTELSHTEGIRSKR